MKKEDEISLFMQIYKYKCPFKYKYEYDKL